MAKQYQLRVHARDVNVNLSPVPGGTDIGNHTGYDLITIHEDGSKTIQYIDLYTNSSLDIGFYISAPVPAQEYTITDEDGNSRTILWGTQTAHDGTMQATTVEYLTEYKVYTSTIIDETNSTEAFKAFNKIKLEATFLQSLKDELVYNPKTRNCNTSTNYFAQQYLNGRNVFAGLPYGIYMGYSDPFYDPNSTSTTDVTIKAVRNIIDKYYSLVGSNVDLSNVNYGVVNQSNAWYAKFTTDDYNYVFAGNGEANIVDLYGDSFIYADAGNHTINAGNGNDVIYGREANVIDGGDGNDIIYAGDQTYAAHSIGAGAGDDYIYAGHGGDDVRGGNGNNTVYLGSGSDKYTGGDDIDIVTDGEVHESLTDLLGVLCQPTDALRLAQMVELGHQRSVEILGEKDEVALVIGHGVDEELHLLEHVVQCLIRPHLPLYQTDTHGCLLIHVIRRRRLVIDIIPLQQGSAMLRLLIVRQVVHHHFPHVEIVGELEGEHRVVDLA